MKDRTMSAVECAKVSPETYEFGLFQYMKYKYEPQGLRVCGTEGGKQHLRRGRFSLEKRQLDVAMYRTWDDELPFFIADAKRHSRPIDVTKVECFIGMMDDVGASIGLLVAPKGFSEAAVRRARAANVRVEIMSPQEALEFEWLPLARRIFPWDWAFHPTLAKALMHLKRGSKSELIIDALEGVAFEEWEAFVGYALGHHGDEAVRFLEVVAMDHFDDGWRYNAVRWLSECGALSPALVEWISLHERDQEILELIEESRETL
jgi:hypothetical protein